MAGNWIKVEHATPSKPEVLRIADLLGIPPQHAVGILVDFWIWLDLNMRNASVTHMYAKSIDLVTKCPGLCGAICAVGWAQIDKKTGIVTIANIETHNGTPAKTRALGRDRSQRNRNVFVTQQSVLDKRSKDLKPKPPTPLLAALPVWVPADAWLQFENHRTACKAKLTPRGRELALKTLLKLKDAGGDPLAILEQSIERGWKGLFAIEVKRSGATTAWWISEAGINAKGLEFGLSARAGESMNDFRGRISAAIEERKAG